MARNALLCDTVHFVILLFFRYGNTSSATVWYSLAYIESVQGVRKGDVVWQVGFGSGFKCNSAVWTAARDIHTTHDAWLHKMERAHSKKLI